MNRSPRHLPFLDAMRGVAILAVFAFHSLGVAFGADALPWRGAFRDFGGSRLFLALQPFSLGWAGVAVFFVISGFCIHLSHARALGEGWLAFWHRRFFRLGPPYLLAVLIFFVAVLRKPEPPGFAGPWVQLVTHAFAVHNLHASTVHGLNPSLWSIAVELQLYALYPVLLALVAKGGWSRTLAVAAAVEFGLRGLSGASALATGADLPVAVMNSPFAFWWSWALGAALADCHLRGVPTPLRRVPCAAVAVAAVLCTLCRGTQPFAFPAFALLSGVVIDRLLSGAWKTPLAGLMELIFRHLTGLGVISYGFYLLHQPMLGLTRPLVEKWMPALRFDPATKLTVCSAWYPAVLLVAWIFWRCVELPSVALGRALWRARAPQPVTAAT